MNYKEILDGISNGKYGVEAKFPVRNDYKDFDIDKSFAEGGMHYDKRYYDVFDKYCNDREKKEEMFKTDVKEWLFEKYGWPGNAAEVILDAVIKWKVFHVDSILLNKIDNVAKLINKVVNIMRDYLSVMGGDMYNIRLDLAREYLEFFTLNADLFPDPHWGAKLEHLCLKNLERREYSEFGAADREEYDFYMGDIENAAMENSTSDKSGLEEAIRKLMAEVRENNVCKEGSVEITPAKSCMTKGQQFKRHLRRTILQSCGKMVTMNAASQLFNDLIMATFEFAMNQEDKKVVLPGVGAFKIEECINNGNKSFPKTIFKPADIIYKMIENFEGYSNHDIEKKHYGIYENNWRVEDCVKKGFEPYDETYFRNEKVESDEVEIDDLFNGVTVLHDD